VQGANLIRIFSLDEIKHFCATGELKIKTWWKIKEGIREDLGSFINVFEPWIPKVKYRCEGPVCDIYIDNTDDYNSLKEILSPFLSEIWEPANQQELNFLINSGTKKIVCDELPYKKYRYKLYIKFRIDPDLRKNFGEWIKNYKGKIRSTPQTEEWILEKNHWPWNPCVYIEDQPTLSMVGMFLGAAVHKVEEYIPRISINTTL
jgi:hypothetical protein